MHVQQDRACRDTLRSCSCLIALWFARGRCCLASELRPYAPRAADRKAQRLARRPAARRSAIRPLAPPERQTLAVVTLPHKIFAGGLLGGGVANPPCVDTIAVGGGLRDTCRSIAARALNRATRLLCCVGPGRHLLAQILRPARLGWLLAPYAAHRIGQAPRSAPRRGLHEHRRSRP
jgi:hypothetical protein